MKEWLPAQQAALEAAHKLPSDLQYTLQQDLCRMAGNYIIVPNPTALKKPAFRKVRIVLQVYGVQIIAPPPPSSAAVIVAALHILQGIDPAITLPL